MRFVVPQFIDVEDKIIGPFSVRQFLIFLGTFGVMFICYKILSFITFAVVGVFLLGASGVFAFANINGQKFHYFLLNIMGTFKKPRLQIWRKEVTPEDIKKSKRKIHQTAYLVKPAKAAVSRSRLTEMSLVVDTGGAYREEPEAAPKSKK